MALSENEKPAAIRKEDDPPIDRKKSREERKTTGRIVALIVALMIILLALYHAWVRKTAILAGIILPALIMVLYVAWVLYTTKKDKYRRFFLTERISTDTNLTEVTIKSNSTLDEILKEKANKIKTVESNKSDAIVANKTNDLPTVHTKQSKKHHHHHHHHNGHHQMTIDTEKNGIIDSKSNELTNGSKEQNILNVNNEEVKTTKVTKCTKRNKRPIILSFNRANKQFNRSFSVV